MAVTLKGYKAGERLNVGESITLIQGFNDYRAQELRPEQLMSHIRIADSEADRYVFKRILPAQVFTRKLVDACPALESSCAVNNEFELGMFDVRYMNEEFRPEGNLTPELKAQFLDETAYVWNREEMQGIFEFLMDTFPQEEVSADFATNGRLEIFKRIAQLEKSTGINRSKFSLILSQDAADTMLSQNIIIPGFYGAAETVDQVMAQVRSTFGVESVFKAEQGQLPAGVLFMVYVKPYVFGGSNMKIAPGFYDLSGDKSATPGTFRYFAEEYFGYDVYNPEVGLIVTDPTAGAEKVEITVTKQTMDIMQADMATYTDAQALADFGAQVVGDDTLTVEVVFNGIEGELSESNYGGGSIVFGVPSRPDIMDKKVHVNVINDATLSKHLMAHPGDEPDTGGTL